MAGPVITEPIGDSVPKINNDLAVGADIEFQRRWWRFESVVWVVFFIIVILDVAGLFGRGPVAQATVIANDNSLRVEYERIERYSTPSILKVQFDRSAVVDNKIQLWVSDSLTQNLGNERIVPQPQASDLNGRGFLYTFPATADEHRVEFALQPAKVGLSELELKVAHRSEVKLKVFVVP